MAVGSRQLVAVNASEREYPTLKIACLKMSLNAPSSPLTHPSHPPHSPHHTPRHPPTCPRSSSVSGCRRAATISPAQAAAHAPRRWFPEWQPPMQGGSASKPVGDHRCHSLPPPEFKRRLTENTRGPSTPYHTLSHTSTCIHTFTNFYALIHTVRTSVPNYIGEHLVPDTSCLPLPASTPPPSPSSL